MVENTIIDGNTDRIAATGVTQAQARARGRLILWLRDPNVDAENVILRLSFVPSELCRRPHRDNPPPLEKPSDQNLVTAFLNRVKGRS